MVGRLTVVGEGRRPNSRYIGWDVATTPFKRDWTDKSAEAWRERGLGADVVPTLDRYFGLVAPTSVRGQP
jgi:hypothetical protein